MAILYTDTVLLNKNGKPTTYDGVAHIEIPNSDGELITYTALQKLHCYYVKLDNSNKTVTIVGYWICSASAKWLLSNGSGEDENGDIILALLTSRSDLKTGATYKLDEL